MRFAASRNEMVVVAISNHPPDVRAYEMKSVVDEPVALQIAGVREGSTQTLMPSDLSMTARVGRFGDSVREDRLLEDIRFRLAELGADPYAERPHPDTRPPH